MTNNKSDNAWQSISRESMKNVLDFVDHNLISYASAMRKVGISAQDFKESMQDLISEIVDEAMSKSRYGDLVDLPGDIETINMHSYSEDQLKRMERVTNATRVIVLPVATKRDGKQVYVSPCVINFDMLEYELIYCELSPKPSMQDYTTSGAGMWLMNDGQTTWLNKEVYEECRQAAFLLTMMGIEVFMPATRTCEAMNLFSTAEMQSVNLTKMPPLLFVASLKRLQENALKELNLNEQESK